jgi:polyisoprenoid-binding protein YceI
LSLRSTLPILAAAALLTACSEPEAPTVAAPPTPAASDPPPPPEPPPATAGAPTQGEPSATEPAGTEPAASDPAAPEPAVEEAPEAEAAVVGDAPSAVAKPAKQEAAVKKKGPLELRIESGGRATFLIDAPLEKIRGNWSRFGGKLLVDTSDLNRTRGEVTMDLSTLKTTTFGNPKRDGKQTRDALNWMEIGPDVSSELQSKYKVARFVIEEITGATGSTGQQTVTARGKLTLHGITLAQAVKLDVTLEGPAGAPTAVRIKSASPFVVSLKGHDVKPRDLAGRFIAGALEKVGEKITDSSQVSIEVRAVR